MLCYSKISLLENSQQAFMCSTCCDPTNGEYFQPFSTSVASLFMEHQQSHHSTVDDIECIYCCCFVPSIDFIEHIKNHFANEDTNITSCPLCLESLGKHGRSIVKHMENKHSSEKIVCPHCHTICLSVDDLRSHLINNVRILFHCPTPGCIVKTHSKIAILNHMTNRHKGSRCVRVECQYNCVDQLIQNSACNCSNVSNLLANSPMNPSMTNTVNPNSDEPQLIDLPYSSRVLMKLSSGLDERLQEDLRSKMEQYSKFKVRLEIVDGQKQFICSTCQYRSVHSLADVRKHILGCHCSVSTSYTRLCLRASRLDTNNLSLFSDRKLISFANEKLKKIETGSAWDGNCDPNSLQLLEDSEPESGSNSESQIRSSKRQSTLIGPDAKKAKMQPRQSHVAKMRPDSPVPEVGPPLDRNENFDRVIQLNFSWPVLEKLVLGQCPDRYLPILKQKMDVYSQHRILLTRRNGKRYFLCSHCPNCSPHGMNDIRKHILGVHARLPERFKSAAMYCSRMNRDNYGLLSDEELLKKNQDMVRWRANPSQSNEEFTLETFSSLQNSLSPEDYNNNNKSSNPVTIGSNSNGTKTHNIFLSGDNGSNGSPNSLTFTGDPVASYYHQHNFSQMPLTALFTSILQTSHKSELSDESSPASNVTVNITDKGRSRRSLVLKSKSTNHHHNNNNNCQNSLNNTT